MTCSRWTQVVDFPAFITVCIFHEPGPTHLSSIFLGANFCKYFSKLVIYFLLPCALFKDKNNNNSKNNYTWYFWPWNSSSIIHLHQPPSRGLVPSQSTCEELIHHCHSFHSLGGYQSSGFSWDTQPLRCSLDLLSIQGILKPNTGKHILNIRG